MAGNPGHHRQDLAICNYGQTVYVAMMIANEPYVLDQCAKVFPSGEGRRLDQQPGQLSALADMGIERLRDRTESSAVRTVFGSTTSTPASFESSN